MNDPDRSWRRVDLEPVLSGQWKPPEPNIGRRADGIGIFYPGKVHTVASESEAGKTNLLLAAAFDELRWGNAVFYVDFEDDVGGVVGRLLTLQADPAWIRDRFCYVRPTANPAPVDIADLSDAYRAYQPTLTVIDGITEAMTMYGLNPNDNKDIATFGRALPRPLATAGSAVVCLDHVTKSTDTRGRYAIGGVHKLNGVDGAAFILENREPFGINLTGRSSILIAKDRPGQLRKHSIRRKDGLGWFGDLILTSHDESYSEFEIQPPQEHATEFKPTHLMAKISDALTQYGPMSQRQIIATVGGKREYVINALSILQRDGHVSDKTPHKLLIPYAEELKSA